MTRHSLVVLTALVSVVISGCSDSSLSDSSVTTADANVPLLDDSKALELSDISHDFEILQFTNSIQNEVNDGVFFDGPGLLDQGFQLLQELKSTSKQTFENLNVGFAEGTVPSEVLECSLYNEGNVLHGFACTEEVDETVLDDFGSALFLIAVEDTSLCASLPLGAFNEVDCRISAFNFVSDSGRYGYYRSFREDGEIYSCLLYTSPSPRD